VIEGLFGENMHSELVKRCGPIVSFLAVRNKLKPEHVAAVLEASRGKHESTVLALYKLLVDMLPHMNGDCLQAIAAGVRSLPLFEWNVQLLGFIRDFAIVAARMDKYVRCDVCMCLRNTTEILMAFVAPTLSHPQEIQPQSGYCRVQRLHVVRYWLGSIRFANELFSFLSIDRFPLMQCDGVILQPHPSVLACAFMDWTCCGRSC
jgi:hypothetical protein